jgi:hypothetical protein
MFRMQHSSFSISMITAFINDWIKTSALSKNATIQYVVEESSTLTGSACCLEVNIELKQTQLPPHLQLIIILIQISIPHVLMANLSIQHNIEKDGVVFDNFCIVAYREEVGD